jgi:hypothetical protein
MAKEDSPEESELPIFGKFNILICGLPWLFLHVERQINLGLNQDTQLLSFSRDCAKSGFASHFEWQLQNVIAPSISNGFP